MPKILQISKDDRLRQKSVIVDPKSIETKRIVKNLKQALKKNDNGLAIAAPQIGENKMIVAIDKFESDDIKIPPMILINPRITQKSKQTLTLEEGCLSVASPEIRGEVTRPKWIIFKYQDLNGNQKERRAEGFFARIIQHEIDHLNGMVFLDRANPNTLYQPKEENDQKYDGL